MMGGSSSSSSSSSSNTNTTNNSGSNAASGDNYGAMVSGINNSDVNLVMTDHGAIAAAGGLADEALNLGNFSVEQMGEAVKDALGANTALSGKALDNMLEQNQHALEGNVALSGKALDTNASLSLGAIDTIKNLAAQQTATTKAALEMADGAKAREQTGEAQGDNDVKTILIITAGVLGVAIAVAYMFKKGKR